jgi:hypothetical protein
MSLDVYLSRAQRTNVYENNITHNFGAMAKEAGIYMHLWRPDELGITQACELIEPLREGLHKLKSRPEHFKTFDSQNGYGRYEHFVPWVEKYLEACYEYPDAQVEVSR